MIGCPCCVTIGSIGRRRLPPIRRSSAILSLGTPTLLACLTPPPSRRYRQTVQGALMDTVFLFDMRHGCVSLPLQCMSIRRQSTVHTTAATPLTYLSQGKVTAWLQSSEDMDRCSKGECLEPPHDLQLSWDSALCDILMYYS